MGIFHIIQNIVAIYFTWFEYIWQNINILFRFLLLDINK